MMVNAVPEFEGGAVGDFFVRPEQMRKHIGVLRSAGDRFNSIPNGRPNPPDAGASTDEVAAILSSLVVSAAALSDMLDQIAELADVDQDAYGIVENEVAGRFGARGN